MLDRICEHIYIFKFILNVMLNSSFDRGCLCLMHQLGVNSWIHFVVSRN